MTTETPRILVWDGAVRLVHWLMVVLVPLLWWTAEEGYMDWHRRLGLTMFGLVLFRLLWGVTGSWTARFVPMVQSLSGLKSYIGKLRNRRSGPAYGHSPLAVLSVFALLGALTLQVTTGLFSVDVDGLESGPLAILVSFDVGRQVAEVHELNFNLLAALIGLHIIAIGIYHFILKEKLVRSMVTGHRPRSDFSDAMLPENRIRLIPMLVALILTLACIFAIANFG
jgi:cytochrome b